MMNIGSDRSTCGSVHLSSQLMVLSVEDINLIKVSYTLCAQLAMVRSGMWVAQIILMPSAETVGITIAGACK